MGYTEYSQNELQMSFLLFRSQCKKFQRHVLLVLFEKVGRNVLQYSFLMLEEKAEDFAVSVD